jgi:hypothetical protein
LKNPILTLENGVCSAFLEDMEMVDRLMEMKNMEKGEIEN